jgi:hypothetical protein
VYLDDLLLLLVLTALAIATGWLSALSYYDNERKRLAHRVRINASTTTCVDEQQQQVATLTREKKDTEEAQSPLDGETNGKTVGKEDDHENKETRATPRR